MGNITPVKDKHSGQSGSLVQAGKEKEISGWKSSIRTQLKSMNYEDGKKLVQMKDEPKKETDKDLGDKAKDQWDKWMESGAGSVQKYDVRKALYDVVLGQVKKYLPEPTYVDPNAPKVSKDQAAAVIADTVTNRIIGGEFPQFYEAIEDVQGDVANWIRTNLAFKLETKQVEHRPRTQPQKTPEQILNEKIRAAVTQMNKSPADIEAEKKRMEEEEKKAAADYEATLSLVQNADTLEGKKAAWEKFLAAHPSGMHADIARRTIAQFDKMIQEEILRKGILKKDLKLVFKPTFDWDKKFVDKVGVAGNISYENLDWHAMFKGETVLEAPFAREATLKASARGEIGIGRDSRYLNLAGYADYEKKNVFHGGAESLRAGAALAGRYDNVSGEAHVNYGREFDGSSSMGYGGSVNYNISSNTRLSFSLDRAGRETRGTVGIAFTF
jgi:hypothetical protein